MLTEREGTLSYWPRKLNKSALTLWLAGGIDVIQQASPSPAVSGQTKTPSSKTGAKTVHLNAPAVAALAGIEHQEGLPWVIAGAKAGTHLVNLEKPWPLRPAFGKAPTRWQQLNGRSYEAEIAPAAYLMLPRPWATINLHS